MSTERFPIQALDIYRKPMTIPWDHAEEAYKEYAQQFGSSQTLERIAQRGGFGATEIIMFLVQRIKRMEHNDRISRGPG